MIPRLGRSPRGGHGNLLQYSCLENPHGQRSLVGSSPWGRKESDMIERLSTAQHTEIVLHHCSLCIYPLYPFATVKHYIRYENVCEGVPETFANPPAHKTPIRKQVENKVMVP